jgi:hypothetical protein
MGRLWVVGMRRSLGDGCGGSDEGEIGSQVRNENLILLS